MCSGMGAVRNRAAQTAGEGRRTVMVTKETLLDENSKFLMDVRNNPARYMEFLNTMAKFHKYSLPRQINLFFHAPESTTAVAAAHVWNDVLGWKLDEDAPAIEILDETSAKVENVYDFRYTDKYKAGTEPSDILWSFNAAEHEALFKQVFPGEGDIAECVMEKFRQEAIRYNEEAGLTKEKISDIELFAMSSAYVVLKRLGYNADDELGMQFMLYDWQDFNSEFMLTRVNEASAAALNYIGAAVKKAEAVSQAERVEDNEQRNSGGGAVRRKMGRGTEELSDERAAGTVAGNGEERDSKGVPVELSGGVQPEGGLDGQAVYGEEQHSGGTAGVDAVAGVPAADDVGEGHDAGVSAQGDLRTGLTDIDLSEFDFSADMSSTKGKRAVFAINMAAIKLAKKLEVENRQALPNERILLKNYRGFGGIPEAFDEFNMSWKKEYEELRDGLTASEYSDAKGSVLNAHFTSPEVIKGIYKAVRKMGFKGGNVLEPAAGSGRFFEEMPSEMKAASHLFGVELDNMTSRIAALAHPEAEISNQGFEETKFANNSFDLAISNVPFGDYKVRTDLPYRDKGMMLHDYFIAKMVDQVRPGGIVAAITSSGTMDKVNDKARKYIASRAELVGAFRLPYTAFKGAGTEVTTDILFFKKREKELNRKELLQETWINSYPGGQSSGSSYYNEHKDNILGVMQRRSGPYGEEWFCNEKQDISLQELLDSAIEKGIPENIYQPGKNADFVPVQEKKAAVGAVGFFYEDGHIISRKADGSSEKPDISAIDEKRILAAIHIREAVYGLLEAQRNNCPDAELAEKQRILSRHYDAYTAQYGRIQQDSKLKRIFGIDPSYPLLRSLEVYDNKTFSRKADIFTKRTIKPDIVPESVNTADDALKISMNERGRVDLEYMAKLMGNSVREVIEELEFASIYYNPARDEYQLADEYLSGDIRQKIDEAEQVIEGLQERQQGIAREKIYPDWNELSFVPQNDTEQRLLEAAKNDMGFHEIAPDDRKYLQEHYDNRNLILINYAMEWLPMPSGYEYDPLMPIEGLKLGRPIESIRSNTTGHYYRELFDHLDLPQEVKSSLSNYLFRHPDNSDNLRYQEYLAPVCQYMMDKGRAVDWIEYVKIASNWDKKEKYFRKESADFAAFMSGCRDKAAEIAKEDETCIKLQQKIEYMQKNLAALEAVKPEDLTPAEISVNLGATWLSPLDVQKFLFETMKIPSYLQKDISVEFSAATGEWRINNKNKMENNPLINNTYGTSGSAANGKNALELCELALNLREAKIYDTVYVDGEERRKLNEKATLEARIKQQDIKDAFRKWIFADEKRTRRITDFYNRHFNNIRPREYNGDFLTFPGMAADITLKKHQKDAIAHTLYGGNTLLAHCVGAGKTYEIIASAMEAKRLGMANKPLIVVPKHLTEQMGEDFQKLYPGAKVLVATDKTFTAKKREEFCSKIATQEWDAIIMGYTQFEKIPLSRERQRIILQEQLNEIIEAMNEYQVLHGKKSFTVKQLVHVKKKLEARLAAMDKQEKKDQTVVFEDMGIDRLYVDEAHYFKNLYTPTKLTNVAGIQTTEADKTMDFYQKCKYINEITGCRGLVFATGTPVSNSMTELYTMQRYLQPEALKNSGLGFFDSWAANFGQQETDMEINPEGQGFRERTRFARFQNLPELMAMFKEIADIKTADMLDLPVPEENIIVERLKPTPEQKDYVQLLAERARQVRDKVVDSSEDNMLKITNEGRLLALDQRLMVPGAPDNPDSKVNKCVSNVWKIYKETTQEKSAQLIFCDKSTPNKEGKFNVYDDIKAKLIAYGVPENEIAFIHDAKTDAQKDALFDKVRKGEVRILLGSTDKMGVGTNVQNRLIATHDLDVPWRPSDLEQRKGRIVRRGNQNKSVKIFRYITEGTFDAYMWQILENKQRFISQIMTSKAPTRTSEDCDEVTLSYAEVKACATGNPLIKEKMEVDNTVKRLEIDKSNYLTAHEKIKQKCQIDYPLQIRSIAAYIEKLQDMKRQAEANTMKAESGEELFSLELNGKNYINVKEAGKALIAAAKGDLKAVKGHYKGLGLTMRSDHLTGTTNIVLSHKCQKECDLSSVDTVNISRMNGIINDVYADIKFQVQKLEQLKRDFELAKQELERPFEKENLLKELLAKQQELDLKIQSTMNEDHIANAEAAGRIEAIKALFDENDDFCPERLPEEGLERAFLFQAAILYQKNNNEWSDELDYQIYCSLVEKYDVTDAADIIIKHSPNIPSYEELGRMMECHGGSGHTEALAGYQPYSENEMAAAR